MEGTGPLKSASAGADIPFAGFANGKLTECRALSSKTLCAFQ